MEKCKSSSICVGGNMMTPYCGLTFGSFVFFLLFELVVISFMLFIAVPFFAVLEAVNFGIKCFKVS